MSCQRSAIVSALQSSAGGRRTLFLEEPLPLLLRLLVVLRWRSRPMFSNGEWEVVSLGGYLRANSSRAGFRYVASAARVVL
jgi:hypothetical protein